MSQKRPQQQQQVEAEEDMKTRRPDGSAASSSSPDDKRRKVPSLRNVVMEVMTLRKVQRCMEPTLEPLIRRVVKEEVELAIRKYLTNMKRSSGKEIHHSESRSLHLQFLNTISLPVFTGTRIEGEDCTNLKVALVDAYTGQVVSRGPESSAKVEIVVLEGDFDGDEKDNWTLEDFKNNIVREREGKKPLLSGDVFLMLKEGIGLVGDLSFTDNSSWTRSRKFRLGARIVDNTDEITVREAKTESFIVRDHRGELYKKHHPPSLSDEVWRLEKIGKDGAFHKRLNKERVYTVKDFLILLFLDPGRLRNILGTGMSTKMWEVTVDHARTCVLDKKFYVYYAPGTQQKNGVVFNVVGQVIGLFSNYQYIPNDKLSEAEKADARNLVFAAFGNWEEVVSFEDESSLMDAFSRVAALQYSGNSSLIGDSDACNILASKTGGCEYPQLGASSPDIMQSVYSVGDLTSLDDYGLHGLDPMDVRFDQALSFPGQVANTLICDTDSLNRAFAVDEHLQFFQPDCSLPSSRLGSPADLHTAVNSFMSRGTVVPVDKAQRRWKMLFSVLRWFSIRRLVADKARVKDSHRYRR